MTAILKISRRISPEEYLQDERSAEVRREYGNEQVYEMPGVSDHQRISGNIFAALHSTLSSPRCEAFINVIKVKIPVTFADVFYNPDVIRLEVIYTRTALASSKRPRPGRRTL